MGYSQKIYTAIKSYFSSSSSLVGIEIFSVEGELKSINDSFTHDHGKMIQFFVDALFSPTTTTIKTTTTTIKQAVDGMKNSFFFLPKENPTLVVDEVDKKTTTHSQRQQKKKISLRIRNIV